MEKGVYALWKREDLEADAFRDRLLGDVADRYRALGVRGLTLNVQDSDVGEAIVARRTNLVPPIAGLLSLWLDVADDRGPFEALLEPITSRRAGYLVVESVPILHSDRRAVLGRRTDGINQVALLERPSRIAWPDWIAHWHGPHRAVALETQCTFHYVRNVVVRVLTPGAPPWEGIVEEGFPAAAMTDPMVWYRANGDAEVLKTNVRRMVESCQVFLDLDRVESHPMSEYRLIEAAAP